MQDGALLERGAHRAVQSVLEVEDPLVLDDVREELTRSIQTSQRELSAAEAGIARERSELAQRLRAAQDRVLDLRERAVAARRLADEETLTLRQIETRLEAWREQSRFQRNLLAGFLDRTGQRPLSTQGEIDMRRDLALLEAHVDAQRHRLYPTWQPGRVVLPDGEIADGDVLTVGPVAWFRRTEPEQSGLIRKDGDMARVSLEFGGSSHAGIEDLYSTSAGVVTFDPTLSRALLLNGKPTEAADAEARFKKAWAGADVTLQASRF